MGASWAHDCCGWHDCCRWLRMSEEGVIVASSEVEESVPFSPSSRSLHSQPLPLSVFPPLSHSLSAASVVGRACGGVTRRRERCEGAGRGTRRRRGTAWHVVRRRDGRPQVTRVDGCLVTEGRTWLEHGSCGVRRWPTRSRLLRVWALCSLVRLSLSVRLGHAPDLAAAGSGFVWELSCRVLMSVAAGWSGQVLSVSAPRPGLWVHSRA